MKFGDLCIGEKICWNVDLDEVPGQVGSLFEFRQSPQKPFNHRMDCMLITLNDSLTKRISKILNARNIDVYEKVKNENLKAAWLNINNIILVHYITIISYTT